MRRYILLLIGLTACSQPAPVVNVSPPQVTLPSAHSLNIVSGNNQVASSGQAFPNPLVVKVLNAQGQGVAGVKLSVTADTRLCQPSSTALTTDAQGEASFTLTAQAATGVSCSTAVAIDGSAASSRGVVTFTGFIRPAQRQLAIPSPLSLPSIDVQIQDGSNSSITLNNFQNLPALDADHVYAVYSFRKEPTTTAVSCVRLVGVLNSGDLTTGSKTFTLTPVAMGTACGGTTGSISTMQHNALSLSLQPLLPPQPGASAVPNVFLLASYATPSASGTAAATAQATAYGLSNTSLFEVPAGASGTVVLESPYLAYNYVNSRVVVTLRNLEPPPPGHFYTIYRQNQANQVFRLGTVSVTGRRAVVSLTSSLPTPSNATPPATSLVDQKGEFQKVFVTLEPVAVGEGDFASPDPSPLVVLDTTSPGVWQLGLR